jgi:circadian clock protein KaiC
MHRQIEQFAPAALVVDPVSSLMSAGQQVEVHAMLLRLIDHLKALGCTALFTDLAHGSIDVAKTDAGISSLMDSWLLLLNRESGGEHNRQLQLLKSRGMAHSNQMREFVLSERGVELRPAYLGPGGALTGSARVAQEARDRAAAAARRRTDQQHQRAQARRRRQIERQIEDLQAELAAVAEEDASSDEEVRALEAEVEASRIALAGSRRVRNAQPS